MGSSNDTINLEFIEEITREIYCLQDKDNTFCVFKSVHEILFVAYPTIETSIVFYDIINKMKVLEIKKAHNSYIIEFRHYLDKINKNNERDLILTSSYEDRNIKVWDFKNAECIFNLKPYSKGTINSACFLFDNNINEILIITSNLNGESINVKESIKVFNLKGEEQKEINESDNETIFIESYYDDNLHKNYIISANKYLVISYDYEENKLYHKYEHSDIFDCTSIVIFNNKNDNKVKLIYSTGDGIIKLWDFHLGVLLNQIKVNPGYIFSICLLDEKYLFSCGKYYKSEVVIINNEESKIKIIHINQEITGKLIEHQKYGKCLITKSLDSDGPLKLWKIKQ